MLECCFLWQAQYVVKLQAQYLVKLQCFFLVAQYFVTGGNFLREVGSARVLQYSQILSLFYRACSAWNFSSRLAQELLVNPFGIQIVACVWELQFRSSLSNRKQRRCYLHEFQCVTGVNSTKSQDDCLERLYNVKKDPDDCREEWRTACLLHVWGQFLRGGSEGGRGVVLFLPPERRATPRRVPFWGCGGAGGGVRGRSSEQTCSPPSSSQGLVRASGFHVRLKPFFSGSPIYAFQVAWLLPWRNCFSTLQGLNRLVWCSMAFVCYYRSLEVGEVRQELVLLCSTE